MGENKSKDFFISYNHNDENKATWIAQILEEAGYKVIIQAWDFLSGSNFVINMNEALKNCNRVIAVISNNYLNSKFTPSEWAEAFRQDPEGGHRKLIPIFIEKNLNLEGLLGGIVGIDLSEFMDDTTKLVEAKEKLLDEIEIPKRESKLIVQKKYDEKYEINICIDDMGEIVHAPDSLISITKWIANGCPPDIEVIVKDCRISKYEHECFEAEERITKQTCNIFQDTNSLLYSCTNLQNIKKINKKMINILKFFVNLNYMHYYININNVDDFISFVKTLKYFIEVGKNKYLNDKNYIAIDFTLKEGSYKDRYYFVVPIKKSAILKTGVSDNLNFQDLMFLDYNRFDKQTRKEIVAIFCQDLEYMATEIDEKLWEDIYAQNLYNYEIGLH